MLGRRVLARREPLRSPQHAVRTGDLGAQNEGRAGQGGAGAGSVSRPYILHDCTPRRGLECKHTLRHAHPRFTRTLPLLPPLLLLLLLH